MSLTQKKLRKLLHYDEKTGVFTWLYRPTNSVHIGDIAGSPDKDGYILIHVNGQRHSAHRLAFLYMTGSFPKEDTDHKDGNPSNNAWSNLREATTTQNLRNRRIQSNNTSGLKGIHKHKIKSKWTGQWRARIKVKDKQLHLGLFDTPEAAHQAYVKAAEKHFGEFANPGAIFALLEEEC
jgi:hypothetical protein